MIPNERRSSLENKLVPERSPILPTKTDYDSIPETLSTKNNRSRSGSSGALLLSLPTLFNSLRTGDRKDSDSSIDSTPNILQRILSSASNNNNNNNNSNNIVGNTKCNDADLSGQSRRGSGNLLQKSPRNSLSNVSSNEDVEVEIFKNVGEIKIPAVFIEDGLALLKVSHKSKKRIFVQIDPSNLIFIWRVASKNQVGQQSLTPSSSLNQGIKGFLASTVHNTKQHKFSIDDIKKILFQLEARYYRDELNISRELEKQWMSISYFDQAKNKIKTLHLIGDTEFDIKRFYTIINNLKKLKIELSEKFYIDLDNMDDDQREFVATKTINTNKISKQYLSFDDIVKYTARLNINVNSGHLKSIFDGLDCKKFINDTLVLDFDGFKQFIAILKKRSDIDEIWESIYPYGQQLSTDGEKLLGFDMVQSKIKEIQHEPITEKLFEKFCKEGTILWNSESLNQYLLSRYCKHMEEGLEDEEYYSKPLNEYFISASHNTYLTGRQVIDESSAEGYVRALQKGCRSVEIDVWDGEDPVTNEVIPVVRHGRAFTSSITFTNVLTTIKKYAFVSSPFPLILSLEINCSADSQLKIVQNLFDILGDQFAVNPISNNGVLPSPNQLKNKILVKAKKTSPTESYTLNENGSLMSSTSTSTSFSEDGLHVVNSGSSSSITSNFKSRKSLSKKVIDELSSLAIYVQGIKFRNFSLPESKTFNHCFSLNEKSLDSMLKNETQKKAIDKHNRRYLMRVYPHKMRLRSSNFIPINYWIHGVQMVATNWQTYDLGQQINEALFDGLNKYGYVLKPKDIRKPLLKHTMRNILHFDVKSINFKFKIISAHQLPKSNLTLKINPFVKFEIIGAQQGSDNSKGESLQTSTISENGFNPIWNESFSGTVKSNELLFIKFTVCTKVEKDEDSILGVFVCKLDYLKKGYRYLPLNDIIGEKLIYSSLFVHINYSLE